MRTVLEFSVRVGNEQNLGIKLNFANLFFEPISDYKFSEFPRSESSEESEQPFRLSRLATTTFQAE